MSEPNVKEHSLNPVAIPFINKALPPNQVFFHSGSVSFLTPSTRTMMTKLTTSTNSTITKNSFLSLHVVKVSGNSCEYSRFKSSFDEIVDTQNISEAQKMTRLLQFLDSRARGAVLGFEEVPGQGPKNVVATFWTSEYCGIGMC